FLDPTDPGVLVIETAPDDTPPPTPDVTPPTAPTNLAATGDHRSITLTWAASTDDTAVAGYETRLNGGAWVDAGNVLTFTWPDLTPETAYQVAVRAYDAAGNHSAPADASRTTPERPWDPSELPNEKLGWYSG